METFLQPQRVVAGLGLKAGDQAADFGAGHGYFTIPLARAVGTEGKVYALDIQKHALDVIRAKVQLEHLLNIDYIWADLEAPRGSRLKDAWCEAVIIANILFQAAEKDALFQEAYRILAAGGRLIVVEWNETPENTIGPRPEVRVGKARALELATNAGFEFEKECEAGSRHYCILFHKP